MVKAQAIGGNGVVSYGIRHVSRLAEAHAQSPPLYAAQHLPDSRLEHHRCVLVRHCRRPRLKISISRYTCYKYITPSLFGPAPSIIVRHTRQEGVARDEAELEEVEEVAE